MAGLYFHIPYCSHKCNYCNFFSLASKKGLEDYTAAVIKEMHLQKDYLKGETLETIYFGGGTPSLLNPGDIKKMIAAAKKLMPVSENPEITLEANPENINKYYINRLRIAGVNRISIGVQSFYHDDLKYLGRNHTASDAYHALKMLICEDFPEITADLIYGVPTLGDTQWRMNLETLTELGIPHISAYALTVEEKTALSHYINKGSLPGPEEETAMHQYEVMMEYMDFKGYEHYEISNFCLPGHYSRHNKAYWQGIPYLGLGPSAHSYNGISRQWNAGNLAEYFSSVNNNKVPFELEKLTEKDRYNEYIMTGIRTSDGVNIKELTDIFGNIKAKEFLTSVQSYIQKGWVVKSNGCFLLTRAGKLFADRVASDLFAVSS
jgi:oxygen-independent coproporphyrinogen III oxidase